MNVPCNQRLLLYQTFSGKFQKTISGCVYYTTLGLNKEVGNSYDVVDVKNITCSIVEGKLMGFTEGKLDGIFVGGQLQLRVVKKATEVIIRFTIRPNQNKNHRSITDVSSNPTFREPFSP